MQSIERNDVIALRVYTYTAHEWELVRASSHLAMQALEEYLNNPANAERLAGRAWTSAYAERDGGGADLYLVEVKLGEEAEWRS